MTTPMKWCEKSAALASKLHAANVACENTDENHQDVLAQIGKAVAEHVGHKGKIPTFHSVRAKLRNMGEYVAKTAPTKPKGGTVISKQDIVDGISSKLGLSDLSTLVNANRADLEAVATTTATLVDLAVHNATREQLEDALESLYEAEEDAIAAGASVSVVAEVEQETANAMSQESADNLEEN